MKRCIIMFVLLICLAINARADNSERIKALQIEAKNLQVSFQQYKEIIAHLRTRFVEVNAIIGELRVQDKIDKEKEKDTDTDTGTVNGG